MDNNFFLVCLIITEFLLLVLVYHRNKQDITVPTVGTLFLFCISMFFTLVGNLSWNKKFSVEMMGIVLAGTLVMILCEGISRGVYKKRNTTGKQNNLSQADISIKRIDIGNLKLIIIIGITMVLSAAYSTNVMQVGKENASFLLKQGIKITMASGFVNSFIFVNNTLSDDKKKMDIIYLIPFVCGCVCSYFTGVRTEMLRLILALFVFYSVLLQEKNGWKNKDIALKKIFKKAFFPVLAFLIIFFLMRSVIKSGDIGENINYGFIMYMAFYIGSPWIVLNQKLFYGLGVYKGNMWAHLTFGILWDDLKDLNLLSVKREITKTFVSLNAAVEVNGNADTIFGSPLIDFGFWGLLIVIGISYWVLSAWYFKYIKYSISCRNRNLRLIIYAFLYYVVGISFYASGLTFIVSGYYLITLILIWMIYFFYFRIKIKKSTL